MDQFEITTANSSAEWWRGCVICQVYPRSYQDSNGDGIGDLAGIRQRLPYIASLGMDVCALMHGNAPLSGKEV